MKHRDIIPAWSRILRGYRPFLALEITRNCPLHCPGCYAFHPDHVIGAGQRQIPEYRGQELVDRVLDLVNRAHPIHISLVGGEPLLRRWEIWQLLPHLYKLGIEVQLVTSAVAPIPQEFKTWDNLHVVVSVDGLQPEHDKRRWPATYARVLENIAGHSVIIHCTATREFASSPGRLREFARFWSDRRECRKIWFSLYTPQRNEVSDERLPPEVRQTFLTELDTVRHCFPKVYATNPVLNGLRRPPLEPAECIFAQVTTCISADLTSEVKPCQLGGAPVCAECGCIASAGLAAVGRFRIAGLLPISWIFSASTAIGRRAAWLREMLPRKKGLVLGGRKQKSKKDEPSIGECESEP